MLQATFGIKNSILHYRCSVGHDTYKLRAHKVQTVIHLLPVGFRNVQTSFSVIQLIRVPLSTVTDVTFIDNLFRIYRNNSL